MFTGIVEELGHLISRHDDRFRIGARTVLEGARIGDSTSVNGCCLTVIALGDGWFYAEVTEETLERTNLADLAPGLTRDDLQVRIDAFRTAMRSKGRIEPDEELLGDAVVLGGVSRYTARVKCAMLAWVAAEDALTRLE